MICAIKDLQLMGLEMARRHNWPRSSLFQSGQLEASEPVVLVPSGQDVISLREIEKLFLLSILKAHKIYFRTFQLASSKVSRRSKG